MFKWTYEISHEVNLPIQKIWEFDTNLDNWNEWTDDFEEYRCEGPFEKGSLIKAKYKKCSKLLLSILITECQLYNIFKFRIKSLLYTQYSTSNYHEISPNKTKMTLKIEFISLLIPFIKSRFNKLIDDYMTKYNESLNRFIKEYERDQGQA